MPPIRPVEFDASQCNGLFIDVGANVGDSLASFYNHRSCSIGPQNVMPQHSKCAWYWPWWMQLEERKTHCVHAFEPNALLIAQLTTEATKLRRVVGPRIRVYPATAWSLEDGNATFGVDVQHGVGSSLQLHRHTVGDRNKKGHGPALSEGNLTTVNTVDGIAFLRSLPTSLPTALKIDVEGHEYELLRGLMLSGALCAHVDTLFVEWHSVTEGAKGTPRGLDDAMKWMLTTHNPKWEELSGEWRPIGHPLCRTTLLRWT